MKNKSEEFWMMAVWLIIEYFSALCLLYELNKKSDAVHPPWLQVTKQQFNESGKEVLYV